MPRRLAALLVAAVLLIGLVLAVWSTRRHEREEQQLKQEEVAVTFSADGGAARAPIHLMLKAEHKRPAVLGVYRYAESTDGGEDWTLFSEQQVLTNSVINLELPGGEFAAFASSIDGGQRGFSSMYVAEGPQFERNVAVELRGFTYSGRVRDGTRPVAGAVLELQPYLSASEDDARTLPAIAHLHARTDAEGRFRLGPLAEGEYYLRYSAPGHDTREADLYLEEDEKENLFLPVVGTLRGEIILPEGAEDPELVLSSPNSGQRTYPLLDGGVFELQLGEGPWRVAARAGELAAKLEKPVVVRRRGVTVAPPLPLEQGAVVRGRVTYEGEPTDRTYVIAEQGKPAQLTFTVRSNVEGEYVLRGLPEGEWTLRYTEDEESAPEDDDWREQVQLEADTIFTRDVELQPAVNVVGRVRDPRGRPVAGVTVLVGRELTLPNSGRSAQTDSAGRYSLSAYPSELDVVMAETDGGFASRELPLDVEFDKRRTLKVADLTLRPLVTVSGRVVDPAGRGVGDVVVVASPKGFSGFAERRARSRADGSFELSVPNETVLITVPWEDNEDLLHNTAMETWVPGSSTPLMLKVTPAPKIPRHVLASGVVLEPTGAPVSGARLEVLGGRDVLKTVTGVDGRFQVLGSGTYKAKLSLSVQVVNRFAEVKDVPEGTDGIRLTLSPSANLAVSLQGANERTSTQLTWAEGSQRRTLAFNGESVVIPGLPARKLRLWASTTDGRAADGEVELAAGSTTHVGLKLMKTASLRARVVLPGTSIPALRAAAWIWKKSDSAPAQQAFASPSGEFSFSGLRAGTWELNVKVGPDTLKRTVELKPGDALNLGDLTVGTPTRPGQVGLQLAKDASGVLVTGVAADSELLLTGLVETGDQLLEVDGKKVPDVRTAERLLGGAPGTVVSLKLRRGGKDETVSLQRAQ